jgi:hypothetical protein
MGGIGLSLEIEPAPVPASKKRGTPRALHRAISRAVLDRIWRRCSYGAFRSTAGMYLSEEQSDGYADDLWTATTSELSWAFMDHAGCCNGSSNACYHWFKVCLHALRERWDKMAAGRGYRIVSPAGPATAALFGDDYPLFDFNSQPLCIPRFELGKLDWEEGWGGPFWDDGSPRPRLADFKGSDRDAVFSAAIAGTCWCGVCWSLRGAGLQARSSADVLSAAWLRVGEDADLRSAAAEVRDEVAGFGAWHTEPAGPPALQRFAARFSAPRPEPWELAGICFQIRR